MSPQESGIITSEQTFPDYGEKPNPRRAVALKKAAALSARIIQDNPDEAIRLFQKLPPVTYFEMGEALLPKIAFEHPGVAAAAVRRALATLLPEDKRKKISQKRKATYFEEMLENLSPDKKRRHQIDAANARNKKYSAYTEKIIEGRGFVRYSNEEREKILNGLLSDSNYKHHGDSSKDGTPDYGKIADALNASFHKGKRVRNRRSLRAYVVWSKNKANPA